MRTTRLGVMLVACVALASVEGSAQGIEAIRAMRDGTVRFTFPLRPGVCGEGNNIRTTGRGVRWNGDKRWNDVEYDVECERGPGRVVLEKSGGAVTDVRFYVGGRWREGSRTTDAGALSARDAAAILMEIARSDRRAAHEAIFPATLVDSVDIAPELLRLARDEGRTRETRRQAVFWLGQMAEGPATQGLDQIVGDAAIDRDVREQAIFALSQRPKDEGVPALVKVVRTSRDPELRRKALFWLGQSDDPRALQLIEELLAKR